MRVFAEVTTRPTQSPSLSPIQTIHNHNAYQPHKHQRSNIPIRVALEISILYNAPPMGFLGVHHHLGDCLRHQALCDDQLIPINPCVLYHLVCLYELFPASILVAITTPHTNPCDTVPSTNHSLPAESFHSVGFYSYIRVKNQDRQPSSLSVLTHTLSERSVATKGL
jgi:hypothetical protein